MHALTLPWRNVTAHTTRSVLTVLGVAIALAGFFAMTGLLHGFQVGFEKGFDELGADLIVGQRGGYTLGESTMPESLGPAFAAVDGVDHVSGTLLSVMTADDAINALALGWPGDSNLWRNLQLASGRLPNPGERGAVVLGQSVAVSLNKSVGDQVELRYKRFRIVGIARFDNVLNQNAILFPLAELQALLSRSGIVTLYQVHLRRPLDASRAASARQRLAEVAPQFAVRESRELTSDLRLLKLIQAVAATLSALVVGIAVLGVGNTILMAVNERTYDIGVLSAIGWPARRIVLMILVEGMTISSLGALIGIGLGFVTMVFAAASPAAAGFLHPYVDATMVGEAVALALAIGLLGALYPAWRAIKLSPAEALRRV